MDRENARLFADIADELKTAPPQSNYYVEAFTSAMLRSRRHRVPPDDHRRTRADPGTCPPSLPRRRRPHRARTARHLPPGFADRIGPAAVYDLAETIWRYAMMLLLLPSGEPVETAEDIRGFRHQALPAQPARGICGRCPSRVQRAVPV